MSSARFYEPGDVLEAGQEDVREHVFQIPRNVPYDLLHVDLQFTYMRKDRGRIDVEHFKQAHASWQHPGTGAGRRGVLRTRSPSTAGCATTTTS